MFANRPGVDQLQLKTETSSDNEHGPITKMLYVAEAGGNETEHYGLQLARATSFPSRFMDVAERAATTLQNLRESTDQELKWRRIRDRRVLLLNLQTILRNMYTSPDLRLGALSALVRLQSEFLMTFHDSV